MVMRVVLGFILACWWSVAFAQPYGLGQQPPYNAPPGTGYAVGAGANGSFDPTNQMAPELQSGRSWTGSPTATVTNSDNTAGFQTAVTALAANRGGDIPCNSLQYNITAAISITTPSINFRGTTTGFNTGTNGVTEGQNGCKIHAGTTGQTMFNVNGSQNLQGLLWSNLYLWGPETSGSLNGGSIGIDFNLTSSARADQPKISNTLFSNLEYGIKVEASAGVDTMHVSHSQFLADGYGFYAVSGAQVGYSQFIADAMSDMPNACVNDQSGYGLGIHIIGGVYVRCANSGSASPAANIALTSDLAGVVGADIGLAGDVAGGSQSEARGLLLNGGYQTAVGNTFHGNGSTGADIEFGASSGSVLAASNMFYGTVAENLLIDAGANENVFFSPNPATVNTSAMNHENILEFMDNLTHTFVLYAATTNNSTAPISGAHATNNAMLDLVGSSYAAALYGVTVMFDATLQGGHAWEISSTGSAAGEGAGEFVINDRNAGGGTGADRLKIDTSGNLFALAYLNVSSGLNVGSSSLSTGTGQVNVTSGYLVNNTVVMGGTYNAVTALTTWTDTQTCTAGQFTMDANYIYVCAATNTVKRAALSSF